MTLVRTTQVRRGAAANRPTLSVGELGLDTDTGSERLWVGTASGNIALDGGFSGVINVKYYGAKGDGTTDDTSSVTTALAAALSATKSLYFPTGTYLLTTLVVTTNVGIKIFGDGMGATVLDFQPASGIGLNIKYVDGTGGVKLVTISDLSIKDGRTTSLASTLINVEGSVTGESPSETAAFVVLERIYTTKYNTATGTWIRLVNISHVTLQHVYSNSLNCLVGVEIESDQAINTGVISLLDCVISASQTPLFINENSTDIIDTLTVQGCFIGHITTGNLSTINDAVKISGAVSSLSFISNHVESRGGASYAAIRVTDASLESSSFIANHFSCNSASGTANLYGVWFTNSTVSGNSFNSNAFQRLATQPNGGAFFRVENDCTFNRQRKNNFIGNTPLITSPNYLSIEAGGNEDTIWAGLSLDPIEVTRYVSLNNAVATSFTPAIADGMFVFVVNNNTTHGGIVLLRAEAAGASIVKIGGGANFEVTTGVLAGTTGTNGALTVSAHTDGKVYIENRQGANVVVYFHQIAGTAFNVA